MTDQTTENAVESPVDKLLNTQIVAEDNPFAAELQTALRAQVEHASTLSSQVETMSGQLQQIAAGNVKQVLNQIGLDQMDPQLIMEKVGDKPLNVETIQSTLDSMGIPYGERLAAAQQQAAPQPQGPSLTQPRVQPADQSANPAAIAGPTDARPTPAQMLQTGAGMNHAHFPNQFAGYQQVTNLNSQIGEASQQQLGQDLMGNIYNAQSIDDILKTMTEVGQAASVNQSAVF